VRRPGLVITATTLVALALLAACGGAVAGKNNGAALLARVDHAYESVPAVALTGGGISSDFRVVRDLAILDRGRVRAVQTRVLVKGSPVVLRQTADAPASTFAWDREKHCWIRAPREAQSPAMNIGLRAFHSRGMSIGSSRSTHSFSTLAIDLNTRAVRFSGRVALLVDSQTYLVRSLVLTVGRRPTSYRVTALSHPPHLDELRPTC
jgi:hypothetical protein